MQKYLDFKEYLKTLDNYNFKFSDVLNYLFENKLVVDEYGKLPEHDRYVIHFTDNTLVEFHVKSSGTVVKVQYGN